jgi:hypothetical protein
MSPCRRAAFALATCAATLTAGCSAGITSASPPKAPATPASHHPAASPSHPATPSRSPSPAATASVAGLGSFPIPSGAQVSADLACGKGSIIQAAPVTPAAASAFYAAALPQAGYTISTNTLGSIPGAHGPDAIETVLFTGHGYSGVIIAMADLNSGATGAPSPPALSGNLTHNVLEITLVPGSNPDNMPKC